MRNLIRMIERKLGTANSQYYFLLFPKMEKNYIHILLYLKLSTIFVSRKLKA